jgi:RibD C-terminal domain
MNNTQKYVASTTLESPEWQNTTVLEGDVSNAVSRLKHEDGEIVTLNGSATLLRSLLNVGLVDELRLLPHPVVLGSGDRLFDDAQDRVALNLTECHTYDNGLSRSPITDRVLIRACAPLSHLPDAREPRELVLGTFIAAEVREDDAEVAEGSQAPDEGRWLVPLHQGGRC